MFRKVGDFVAWMKKSQETARRREAARRLFVRPQLEGLEERIVPTGPTSDTWLGTTSASASLAANWLDNNSQHTVPGTSTQVTLTGASGKNNPITWDSGGQTTVDSISMTNGYSAQQEITSATTLTATNGYTVGGTGATVKLKMDGTSSTLEISGGTNTLTNFDITGQEGEVLLDGTCNMTIGTNSTGPFSTLSDWNVGSGATLNFGSSTSQTCPGTTTFGGASTKALLLVTGGTVNFNNASGTAGVIFLQEGAGGNYTQAGQYLRINSGTVNYNGKTGNTDFCDMPVYLLGGTFNVGAGKLEVLGNNADTQSCSVYNNGGTVSLNKADTLYCGSGLKQASGTFQVNTDLGATLDAGSGSVTITGGTFKFIDQPGTSYDTLTVNGDLTASGGTFYFNVDGGTNNGSCDKITVTGNLNANGATANLNNFSGGTGYQHGWAWFLIDVLGAGNTNFSTYTTTGFGTFGAAPTERSDGSGWDDSIALA
jgi:hypothetical protein